MIKQALNWVGIMPRCYLCGEACQTHWALCNACHNDLPTLNTCCRVCALPLEHPNAPCGDCLKTTKPYQSSYCAFVYQSATKQLIKGFKQQNAWALGHYLCEQWVSQHKAVVKAYTKRPKTLITSVPSAKNATLKRGYAPTDFIAQQFAKATQLPLKPLLKSHPHTPQKSLNRVARLQNLRGVFFMDATQKTQCQGQHIVLVDDVITSGATAITASNLLLQQGAASVTLWALARTPKP